MQPLRLLTALLLVWQLAACAINPYSLEGRQISQQLQSQQRSSAASRVQAQPVSMVFSAFALHDGSTAFQGDVAAMAGVVDRMTQANVQLKFSNAQMLAKPLLPFATETDLAAGLTATAELAEAAQKRSGKAPLVVVLLTSHGNTGNLSVSAGGTMRQLPAAQIVEALAPLSPFPTLVVISACHSGSLIPPLRRPNRIIMTASSADRVSFGCQADSERTWFIDSLSKSFAPELTLRAWFAAMASAVAERERQMNFKASQPQLFVGRAMQPAATVPLAAIADAVLAASTADAAAPADD